MTELPTEFKPLGNDPHAHHTYINAGIGARKFRTHVPEGGDRSVWTDTPEDRRRKMEVRVSGDWVTTTLTEGSLWIGKGFCESIHLVYPLSLAEHFTIPIIFCW